jgi:23S rRNA (cytosine1962-C5)-methyltransferase
VSFIGEVQGDPRFPERPGNLVLTEKTNTAMISELVKRATINGAQLWPQLGHAGALSYLPISQPQGPSALAIEGSQPALDLAAQGAEAMGVSDKFATRKGDAFDVLTKLAEEGETFDVVICDPPAFAPSRKTMEAGLRAYERVARLAAPLVADGGYLGVCSCSHAADLTKFRNASSRGIGRAGRRGQIIYTGFAGPDHPLMPHLAETGYLKSVFFRL